MDPRLRGDDEEGRRWPCFRRAVLLSERRVAFRTPRLIHVTVAVARFMEILFWDIARAACLLAGAALLAVGAALLLILSVRRMWRRRR